MKRWLLILARVGFVGAAFGLLGWQLAGDAGAAAAAIADIGAPAVAAAFLAAATGLGASGLAWRSLLHGLGSTLGAALCARVFFLGQIGKYIPGAVWAYLAQAKLGREHGEPASRTTAASGLFVIALTATGAGVATLVLPVAAAGAFDTYGWVVLLAPLLLAMLHPRVVLPALRLLHRSTGRGSPPEQLSGAAVLRCLGWLTVTWLAWGASMLALVAPVARAGADPLLAPFALGGFALAWTVGFLAAGLFAPAGLGVREVVLFAVLGQILTAGAAVAAIVLLSRVVHTLADGAWALAGLVLRRPGPPGQEAGTERPDTTPARGMLTGTIRTC